MTSTHTMKSLAATTWDVIIIGAGPAGTALALELSRRGLQILLVDQATFPRDKVCGGCLNGNALAALGHLGLADLPRHLGGQPVQQLRMQSKGRLADIRVETGISVSRSALDAALIKRCIEAGVMFQCGVRAYAEAVEHGKPTVSLQSTTENITCHCHIVILAHGLKTGTAAPKSRIGAGVVLADAPPAAPLNTISMAIAGGGYVGGVHAEAGRYVLAAAFDARFVKASGSLGHAAAEVLRQAGLSPIPGLEHAAWKGTPLLTRKPERIAGDRWFVVGDAAGYVEPFTGEGMAWAIGGALALAPIVHAAIKQWDDAHVHTWIRTHASLVGQRQLTCRLLAKLLRSQRLTSLMISSLGWCPALAWPFVRHLNRPTALLPGEAL